MQDRTHFEIPDMSHMIPIRISVDRMKAMSDAELLAALNGEDGRKGMMTMQLLQTLTSELQSRSVAKASKPHWSLVPSFWLLVTSVVISLVALAVALIALPQFQQYLTQVPPSAPASAPEPSKAASTPPLPASSAKPQVAASGK